MFGSDEPAEARTLVHSNGLYLVTWGRVAFADNEQLNLETGLLDLDLNEGRLMSFDDGGEEDERSALASFLPRVVFQ